MPVTIARKHERWIVCLVAVTAVARSDAAEARAEPNASESSTLAAGGFWPTPKMVELILMKGVDAITKEYGLDETQRAALKKDFLTRYPELLNRHRGTLQPMLSEIIELELADQKPTAEQVAGWARRFDPVLTDARKALRGTYEQMGPVLRPDQKRRWDSDYAKIWVGVGLVEAQVTRWKQGMFKPDDWPPKFSRGRSDGPRPAAATRPAPPPPGPEPTPPLAGQTPAPPGNRFDLSLIHI